MIYDMIAHLHRQAAFSHATFGPGPRTFAVQDHIQKEFREIELCMTESARSSEWVDVAILGLDGLLRSVASANPDWTFEQVAQHAVFLIAGKQARNERRRWPNWRTADPNKAIEHDRSGE